MSANELLVRGCRTTPLAAYLKALGILRLVNDQLDVNARGYWRRDCFVLETHVDRSDLSQFFLNRYSPTPIVAPWGARSGFYPDASEKAARKALRAIESDDRPRLARFRKVISDTAALLEELGFSDKADVKPRKTELMEACRARLADDVVSWMDACYTLFEDRAKYPPLLGSGGSEGSLSYVSGFYQQVQRCLILRAEDGGIEPALWSTTELGVCRSQSPGHFYPTAGGDNTETGFGSDPTMNPWDYLLLIEGAILFAASSARRMEADAGGTLSYPFTVRQTGVGYGSASPNDEKHARAEMWMPIWHRPASAAEIRSLLSEGRARIDRRRPRNGVDFARAVAMLGVDRGIAAFQRYGFQVRNGDAHLAVPLERVPVRLEPRSLLLAEIDGWLDSFRRRAGGDKTPNGVRRALRRLDEAIFALCTRGDALRTQDVLIALGGCERAMATSLRWTTDKPYPRPIPSLSPDWLRDADDGSPEFRLAAAIASVWGRYGNENLGFRQHLEPIGFRRGGGSARLVPQWMDTATRDVVWSSGPLVDQVNAVLARRLVRAVQAGEPTYPDRGRWASLGDVAVFVDGNVDDARLADLVWGCALIDRIGADSGSAMRSRGPRFVGSPGALYGLLKLCFAGVRSGDEEDESTAVPIDSRIHHLAARGNGSAAAELAIRRLRGSGFVPAVSALDVRGGAALRAAAALLFPIGPRDLKQLSSILRPQSGESAEVDEHKPNQEGVVV